MRQRFLRSTLLGAVALGAIGLAGTGVAQANPVQIGLATTSGISNITNASTLSGYYAGDGFAAYAGSFGSDVSLTIDNGQGTPYNPEPVLGGQLSASFTSSGTLYVYISETNLTTPASPYSLQSALSISSIPASITSILEQTWVDPNNNAFALTDQMASQLFTGTNSIQQRASTPSTITGKYSLTELFVIKATGSGLAAGSITTSVPEPGSLALLGTGLLGLGLIARRRRRKA